MALRSNTNKAKANIREYIIRNYDPSNYDLPTETEFPKICKQIMETWYTEVGQYKRYNVSFYESFKDWCSGLPSILDTCYYYNRSAVDDLGAILEETEAEKAKFSESEAEEKLTWFIYREITNAIYKTYRINNFRYLAEVEA